jgi:hypothetical protein
MWYLLSLLLSAVFFLIAATDSFAVDHKTVPVPAEGAKRLDVRLDFGAGNLWIMSDTIREAAVFDITYDSRKVDYLVDYDVTGSTGHLTAESDHKENGNIDTDDNKWEVRLSRDYPLELSLDIGACDAEIDLGGLQVEDLSIEVGATSTSITFSEPNPGEMQELRFEAGASSVKATRLGNANFRECSIEGGAASLDLDFRGEYRGESEISVEIGMGSADIVLPKDVPCRIEGTDAGFLASVDIHGGDLDRLSDDEYETPDFDKAKIRIILRLDIGVGSANVRFR